MFVNNNNCVYAIGMSFAADDEAWRPTRAEQNAASGRRLLEALIELVAEKGYEATSAAEIGLRAGFSRAMVHARYGTKDALLDDLMHTEYWDRLAPDIDQSGTGLDRVLGYLDRLDNLASEDERFLRAMFILSFEAVRGSPALNPRISGWLRSLESGVAEALDAGQTDGSVRSDIDIRLAARDVMNTGFGIAYAWIVLNVDLHAELARWRDRVRHDCANDLPTRSTYDTTSSVGNVR